MKKRIVCLFNVLVLSVFISGCGNNGEKQSKQKITSENKVEEKLTSEDKAEGKELISEDEAKEIALKDAGINEEDLSNIRVKLETDDGVKEYDIEFYSGRTEYEYDIDAVTGKILGRDMDTDDFAGR